MRLRGSQHSKHAISTMECTFASLGLRMVCCSGSKMQGWHKHTHTHAHTNTVQAYSQTHILIQTDRHTYTHTHHKIAGCGRILEVLMDAKDFLFLSFFFFFFYSRAHQWRQLFLLHLHRCSQPSLELLPFLCRSKAQRDGDERAPAVVGADFRAHRWMLLQWACTSEGGWWSLMWLETC